MITGQTPSQCADDTQSRRKPRRIAQFEALLIQSAQAARPLHRTEANRAEAKSILLRKDGANVRDEAVRILVLVLTPAASIPAAGRPVAQGDIWPVSRARPSFLG